MFKISDYTNEELAAAGLAFAEANDDRQECATWLGGILRELVHRMQPQP
jgi:hypothetical protein